MLRLAWFLASSGLLWFLILAWVPAGARSSPETGGQADLERLKDRVNEYFRAVHSRQFAKAGDFILPRSRDAFSTEQPRGSRIIRFGIVAVRLEDGNRSAVVTIRQEALASGLSGPLKAKRKTRWKKEAGEWFLDPSDPPKTDAEIFREYYYGKRGRAPTAEFEKKVFEFDWITQGDPLQPRFSFRNPSSGDIVVERIHGPEWMITDRTEKRVVPAGAAGEIRVELNTSRLHRDFVQDIFVQFEPVKEMVKLRIKGKVYTAEDVARSPILSKEAAERKAAREATP